MKRKYFLVCNPSSNNFQSKKKIADYMKLLNKKKIDFDHAFTLKRYDGTHITKKALASGYNTIVAVGGDGTINEVINGFFDNFGNAHNALLGILYSGTSPDFCKYHQLPLIPEKAIDHLLRSNVKKIDVGFMKDHNNNLRYFSCSTNLGLGVNVASRANIYRKYLGDFAGTLLASVISILTYKPFSCTLSHNGKICDLKDVFNITIAKNPYLASGLKLNSSISSSDGKLLLFSFSGINRFKLLFMLPKIYSGKIINEKCFTGEMISQLNFNSSDLVEAECDGDPTGLFPVEINIKERAVNLIGAVS